MKITDFGLAKLLVDNEQIRFCGGKVDSLYPDCPLFADIY